MMTPDSQVLLAGLDDWAARRLVLELAAFDLDFMRVPFTQGLARMLARTEFHVIVVSCNVRDGSLERLLDEVRSPASRSRFAGVVLLVQGNQLCHARRFVGRGVGRVRSLQDPPQTWAIAVSELLYTPPRFPLRAPVWVTVNLEHGPVEAACRTENVSLSGMLLRCGEPIPVGSLVGFSLEIEGEERPIRGSARVARATDPEREGMDGIGAAFVSFQEADRSRLRTVLARQTA